MSIEKDFEHIFQCGLPPQPTELEWRKHPTDPIEVSNCGAIRVLGDEEYEIIMYKEVAFTGKRKMRLVYEAWNNVILPQYCRIYNKNLNPYDVRPDNIGVMGTGQYDPEVLASTLRDKKFRDATVAEMFRREEIFGHKYDMLNYFTLLEIPYLCMKIWKQKSKWYLKHYADVEI
jgi:hypothetical protein